MENYKKVIKDNKFELKEFTLPNASYSASGTHDYFEYIFKKHVEKNVNPSIRIFVNKIENRITFRIKTGHHLEFLTPKTMRLFGSTKDKNGENVPHLEISTFYYC